MIWMALRHEMGRIMPISLNYKKKTFQFLGLNARLHVTCLDPT